MSDPRRWILYAGGVAVAALVTWALVMIGSPATQRQLAEDRLALEDAMCLACHAERAACEDARGRYPATKADLLDFIDKEYCYQGNLSCSSDYYPRRRAEKTLKERLSAPRYELRGGAVTVCAQFHRDGAMQRKLRSSGYTYRETPEDFQDYRSGGHCFAVKPRRCEKGQAGYEARNAVIGRRNQKQ